MGSVIVLLVMIYLRVSTRDQERKGYSLPEQSEACRMKAREIASETEKATGKQVDLQIVEFTDTFGGDVAERPVLEEVRDFVRARRPAWFVCMDPDRFSRELTLQLVVTEEIEKAGTRLAFVLHNYEKTAEGKLFYQMRGAISEFEKAKILERTSRGKRGKVKAGRRPNGAEPYGYRHNKETDQLELYEPEAQWVRQIFAWIAEENITSYEVALRLNSLGVRTKRNRRWRGSTVRDIIRNTSYIGQMRCNRWDLRGLSSVRRLPKGKRPNLTAKFRPPSDWKTVPVPALVDPDLFALVGSRIRESTKKGGRRHAGLLSMLVRCGVCGGHMAYSRNNQTGRYYIKCNRRYADLLNYIDRTRCPNRHHHAAVIEAEVWQQIAKWLTDPRLLEVYLQELHSGPDLEGQVGALTKERNLVAGELADRRREQATVISQLSKGNIRESEADALLAGLRPQVDYLEQRLATLDQQVRSLQESIGQAASAAARARELSEAIAAEQADVHRLLESMDQQRRRELVLQIVREVIIKGDGTWTILPV